MRKSKKNGKIALRLRNSYVIIIGCFVVSLIIAIGSCIQVGNSLTSFYEDSHTVVVNAVDMRRSFQSAVKNLLWATTTLDVEETAKYIDSANSDMEILKEGIAVLRERFAGDQNLVETFYDKMMSSVTYKEQVIELLKVNRNEEAIKIFKEQYTPVLLDAQDYLIKIGDDASQRAESNYNRANLVKNISNVISIVLAVVSCLIAFRLCVSIIGAIRKPLEEIDEAAREMAKGSLKVSIAYNTDDEFGSLAGSMRVLTKGISDIIGDIEYCLGSMADGDFTVKSKIEQTYIGDYTPILAYMKNINEKLRGTLSTIHEATEQVNVGARNLSEGAMTLAEGATNQAASIEELTATINEITVYTESNTKRTDEVSDTAVRLGSVTMKSKEQMDLMQNAMEKISETSNKIEKIINTIESIASQTNLLSLNASIEAARAGEAGKGFAVVADEIGELANQSAQAAVNTRTLIQSSLNEVKNGNEISAATAHSLLETVDGIDKITAAIKEVKEASDQQLVSMQQIGAGVEQISVVIESNSASAEESSATSEELLAQAESLNNLVMQFKL